MSKKTTNEAAYTLIFPRPLYVRAKILCAIRGQSLKDFMKTLVENEVKRAIDEKEIPKFKTNGGEKSA